MSSFAQELLTNDRACLDLRAGLPGLGVIAAFVSELTKHRASAIARLRPHDDPSDPDAGGSQGFGNGGL